MRVDGCAHLQREIQAAVGAVISLAKYRELLWNRRAENRNGHPGKFRKWPFFLWALKGLNLRLPPCEGGTLPLS